MLFLRLICEAVPKSDMLPQFPKILILITIFELIVAQGFAQQGDSHTNLFSIKDSSALVAEPGVDFALRRDTRHLVVRSVVSSDKTPAIYFGKIKVVPGQTYTYVVKCSSSIQNKARLYVISPQGNVVWPGNEMSDGLTKNTFVVPQGTDEITLGIALMYPSANEYVEIHDLGLFAGSAPGENSFINGRSVFHELKLRGAKNLFVTDTTQIKPEKTISYAIGKMRGKEYLLIKCGENINATPAIYLGSIKVQPGKKYSYIVKAEGHDDKSAALYVSSKAGNMIWPGSMIKNGYAKNTFLVPPDVTEVTLGIGFLYPVGTEHLQVEDIGVFEGDDDVFFGWESSDDQGLRKFIVANRRQFFAWQSVVLVVTLVLPFVLFFFYRRLIGVSKP